MPSLARLSERARAIGARTILRAPRPVLRRIAGSPAENDRGAVLDLHAQALLRVETMVSGGKTFPDLGLSAARRVLGAESRIAGPPGPPVPEVRDRTVPGRRGPIPVRIYRPLLRGAAPMLVYYHGGGFVLGDIESHDGLCRLIADRAACVVVSVDYRLAPEHPFPAGIEDGIDAYKWLAAHAPELGADPARVAVGGDSAGGNLAAVVCHQAEAVGAPMPAFQLLVYPATDLRGGSVSRRLFADGYYLTREVMDWFSDQYFGAKKKHVADPLASPLLADRFDHLPPAHVVTGGFDPLRDEGEQYAAKLREAGVEVTEGHADSLIHGFASMAGLVPEAARQVAAFVEATRVALSRTPARASGPQGSTRAASQSPG